LTILDRSKSAFLTLIQHEFRTPLNGLLGVSSILLEDMPDNSTNNELRMVFDRSRRRILSILNDAALLARVESSSNGFPFKPFSLSAALRQARESAADFAESRNVSFHLPAHDLGQVTGSQALMARAWQALLETAVKFSASGETVTVSECAGGHGRELKIQTRGSSIPGTALPVFFDLFSIGEALTPGGDLGVGPALACRILALTGASVSVQNCEPSGVEFRICLK
jgi:signal transduction histidine kinase